VRERRGRRRRRRRRRRKGEHEVLVYSFILS
jgi:hypothetical protein